MRKLLSYRIFYLLFMVGTGAVLSGFWGTSKKTYKMPETSGLLL